MSYLRSSYDQLKQDLIEALEGEGFPYNPLTTEFTAYLSTALGTPNAYLRQSLGKLLAVLDAQYGGSLSERWVSIEHLMDDVTANIGAGGGGDAYVAQAVHFDGSAWLTIDSLSSTDNGQIALVFWSKLPSLDDGFGHDLTIIYTDPEDNGYNYFQTLHDTNSWDFSFSTADPGGAGESARLADDCNTVDVWNCVIFTADTNHDSGERIYKTYINDTYVANVSSPDPNSAFLATFNGLPLFIGGDGSIQIVGDFADLRFMPGVSLLDDGDIPLATRRLFIDADGKPVDPAIATAALGTPCVLFSGDASGFATNQGNGGTFTLTGAITDADASEPVQVGAGGGGGGGDAGAVFWDGTSKLHNDALACGDHSKISVVVVYKQPVGPHNTPVLSGFWVTDPTGAYASYSEVDQQEGTSNGGIQFSIGAPDGSFLFSSNSTLIVEPTVNQWHCYMMSADISSGGVANVVSSYLDDTSLDAGDDPGSNPGTVIAGNGVPLWIGSINEAQLNYSMARYFVWYGQQIDWSDAANRRKFFTIAGALEDPSIAIAEFGEPTVKFYGNSASWQALATSQGFVLDGSLTDAADSPAVA